MNRSKLSLALLAAAIAALGLWLWSLRGDGRAEFAAPAPPRISNAAESRVELEPVLATKGVDEPRQAARASESAPQAIAKSGSASHDFTVRGHVFVRGTRVPIAGADVALCEPLSASIADSEGEPFARATSDEQGAYEIALPGGAPREFALLATHDDFAPTWQDKLPSDAGDLEIDVELDTHFFVGVDVWAPGGRAPVFAADVRLSTATPAFSEAWLQDITDERGHCEFEVTGLPRTDLELIVAADGCAPCMMRNLRLEPGVKRINLTCNLEPPRRVRGRVIDALRKQPIADAELEIVGRREDFDAGGGEARSDANGEFELELESCPLEFASVYARAKGYRAARFDQLEHNVELVIELGAPAKLRGTLRVGDGLPLDGATIEIAPSGLSVDASDVVALGTDGAFELQLDEVPYGLARLTCEAEGCVTKAFDIIAADTGAGALDITLERALHLHGRVLRAGDSRPVPDVRVRLLGANGASAITFSNAAGRYEFYVAPKDVVGARLTVELGGQRLAVSELQPVKNPLELEHDITLALVAPSKPR
jgi:hypothetical protein